MNNTVKNVILAILAVGLIGMTIAYAALTQKLTIDSTAAVNASTWDVHFANLSDASTVGNPAPTVTDPTLSAQSISGLDVAFTKPGESVTYTFDIVNAGTIPARLNSIKINAKDSGITCTDAEGSKTSANATLVCNNLSFSVTHADDSAFTVGEVLGVEDNNKTQAAKLVVTFDGTEVPSSKVTVDGLDAVLEYIQN